MRYLYILTLTTALFTYMGLCWLKPIQQDIVKRQHQDEIKSQYNQAKQACMNSVGVHVSASLGIDGMIYCISSAGKLVATISGNQP